MDERVNNIRYIKMQNFDNKLRNEIKLIKRGVKIEC